MVEIPAVPPCVDHGIDRTGPSERLPARPEKRAVAGFGISLRPIQPIVYATVHQIEHVQWIAVSDPIGSIRRPGFQQTHRYLWVFRQSIRQDTSRRSSADDEKIEHDCLLQQDVTG